MAKQHKIIYPKYQNMSNNINLLNTHNDVKHFIYYLTSNKTTSLTWKTKQKNKISTCVTSKTDN